MVKNQVSVRQSLKYVADHPEPSTEAPIDLPVWEAMGRSLFQIANTPDATVRGSLARASKAQRMIADRLVGTRRPGTHPAVQRDEAISFVDLTAGSVEA